MSGVERIAKPFRLTPTQRVARQLLRGPQTHTCLVGGSRSGKTFLYVYAICSRAFQSEGSRHLISRFHGNAVRASIWLDTFPKVIKFCFPEGKPKTYRQDGFEEFPNGSQVWFGGLDEKDRTEKILGQEYATIYANECSQTPYTSILTMRTRLAQSGTGLKLRAYYDLNPTTIKHWSHVEFGELRDPISGLPLENPENFKRMFINPEDNAENLDPDYIASLRAMPAKFKQRFYEGKYVVEIDGALWTSDVLEMRREKPVKPGDDGRLREFRRIVVGVDPSGAQSKFDIKSDEIGIVVMGKRQSGRASVLEDATMRGSPKEWGERVVAMFRKWSADAIVAEANFGGEMVRSTIQAVDHKQLPVKLVKAARGKMVRAEPVAALYGEDKIRHAGRFDELESQLCDFSDQGYHGTRSPDRADAMVWAAHELMLDPEASTYTLANIR